MSDLTEALRRADIDYRTTPDGTVHVDRADGAWVALGESDPEPGQTPTDDLGYDAAFYGEQGARAPQRQDWFPTALAVADDVRLWMGTAK